MSIAFTYYARVKNKLCLAYLGLLPEYVTLLKLVRPCFKKVLPELELSICCTDDLMYLLEGEPDVIPHSQIRDRKTEFAYIREVGATMSPPHPIYEMLVQAGATSDINIKPRVVGTKRCLICPDGGLPTQPMKEVDRYREIASSRGYDVKIIGSDVHSNYQKPDMRPSGRAKVSLLETADWVIGVENEYLYEAVGRGVKTSLYPSGIGTELYRLLCPKGEILQPKTK